LAQALADYEASQAAASEETTPTTRRRLQANPDWPDVAYDCDPTLDFDSVQVDVMENANFSAENMAFIRCFKDYADAGDAYMAE
jgi:hypothetical protein